MMKPTHTFLKMTFFSFLALTMIHCGSAGDGGTTGSKFVAGETQIDSSLAVPVLSVSKSGNDLTLTIDLDVENTYSYTEVERKIGTNGDFEYLDELQTTTFVDENLAAGTYSYRVRAVHEENGQLHFSDFSEAVSATVNVTWEHETDPGSGVVGVF